jgi:hypothetical protein
MVLPVVLIVFLQTMAHGQTYFRIEAKVSIKNKEKDGLGSLMMGKLYYDIHQKKLVYDLTFPEKEVWVVRDTISTVYRNNILYKTEKINPFVETTIFHKCLVGNLNDFGLKNSLYSIDNIERDQGLVITTWLPPSNKAGLGPILTSTQNNVLYGVIFKTPDGDVFNKQIYKEYVTVSGLKIPTEIIQVITKGESEIYQIVNLSEIKVNSTSNEKMYIYPYPYISF